MLEDVIKELEKISANEEIVSIKRTDLPDFCIRLLKLVKKIYKSESFNYENMYKANIKLQNESKELKRDLKTLVDYLKGNSNLKEQVEEIMEVYKKRDVINVRK